MRELLFNVLIAGTIFAAFMIFDKNISATWSFEMWVVASIITGLLMWLRDVEHDWIMRMGSGSKIDEDQTIK